MDIKYLGCDVFVLSQIAILEDVFGFGSKGNFSSQNFFIVKMKKIRSKI